MTEQEKQELKQEIITQIESESQNVTELEEVSSLDGVKTLPALRGTELVSVPVSLLGKPATDAAAQALAAKTQAEGAANSALAAAENANAKAREAAEAAQIMVATGHEAFIAAGSDGGIEINTMVPNGSGYKVVITIRGTMYVSGSWTSYARYKSTPRTIEYSSYGIQFLLFDTAADDGQGDFVLRSSPSHKAIGSTEYIVAIFRLPVGYALEDNNGVYKLNCGSYSINGVKYLNRFAPSDWQAKLISGTNIKTINNQSLLGSGNIIIEGGGGPSYDLAPRYKNPPFPCDADKLRVLCIGNSFTADTLKYVGTLISNSSLRSDDLYIASFIKSSAEIDEWIVALKNAEGKASGGPWIDLNWQGDNITPIDNTLPFCDIIASQPWDVITVQQDSDNCYNYTTYRNLPELIRLIRELCPNKNVCLGWIMAWATAAHDTWQANADNARRMAAEYGIDIIVPSGTVVENIKTNLVGDSENVFTKYYSADKVHLRYGAAARYAVGCAFWETIIKPWSGISILGCPTNVDAGDAGVQVTDVNRLALQLCATAAVTDISGSTAIEIPTATSHPTAAEIAAAYAAQAQKPTKQDALVSGTNIKTINNQSLLGSGNMLIGDDWQFLVQYKTAEGATYPLPTADSFDGLLIHFTHEYRTSGTGIPIYGFSSWIGTYVMPTGISETVVWVEKRGDAIIMLAGASDNNRGLAIRVRQWDESCRNSRPYFSIPASGGLLYTDNEYITVYIKPRKDE